MAQTDKDGSYYSKNFREIDVLHRLQLAPQEREWLLTAPRGDVKPVPVVLYLGCNVLRTTHLARTVVDIFKLLGVDFVAVAGAAYCCGILHHRRGDTRPAHAYASATARNFQRFSPERVVMWCPSCIYFYDEIMEMRESFFFQHVAEFLVENLDRLRFQPQPAVNVAFHHHTGNPHSDAEGRCMWQLLSALPGVNLVDLGADQRLGRQCNPASVEQLGAGAWEEIVGGSFRRAVQVGADVYCTPYHGCQRRLCLYEREYPLKVEHYLTVVGRGLGIEHEDLYKRYLMMGDADAVWADAAPCAAASGLKEEDARPVIEKTFVDADRKSLAGR